MRLLVLAAVISGLPLAAAAQNAVPTLQTKEDFHNFAMVSKQRESTAKTQISGMSKADVVAALKTNLSDKTKIIYQDGYGVYIEYSGADGSDRMWFPGNRGIVKGTWGVEDKFTGTKACFHYLKPSGEPDDTQCISPAQTIGNSDVIDEKTGDVFNLLSNKIPYVKTPLDIPAWP